MMSMETTKRVWQARLDPRRSTPSIGIYSHVHDRWGIFNAQPFVLNERQAGVAIEGVVRQERIETSQLAVDTHGHTDFAMALARLLGFDLCPRLKDLKQRHLFLARGMTIPAEIASLPHERCAARGAMLRVGDNHGLKSRRLGRDRRSGAPHESGRQVLPGLRQDVV